MLAPAWPGCLLRPPEAQRYTGRPACQGLTSEPRTGLGAMLAVVGGLPDAERVLLLGEESEGWGRGGVLS